MPNLTETFIEYLFNKRGGIDEWIRNRADNCLRDYLAVTMAGAKHNAVKWARLLEHTSKGDAELIGYSMRADSRTAALINGFNAHALELDDGQRFAMIHLGASVISALLAAEGDHRIAGDKRLEGIVMGYEAACRAAIAMQPSHKQLGYHAAGTCGTIGAAVGVAFALQMDKRQMKRVLTTAAGSAAGLLEIQSQGSELKPYNLGRAAMDGLSAAYMGLAEFDTPDDMLGGERGFFRRFSDQFSLEKLTGAAEYFEIERIYVKPYASCRHSHSAVEAAIQLHARVPVEDIASVEVLTYRLGVKGHDHTQIRGVASAKLSTPYAVAAGLLYGRADLAVFEALDGDVLALARKVRVSEDPKLSAECPEKRIAIIKVITFDGMTYTNRVDYARGEPENPLTEADMEAKQRMLFLYANNQ